MQVFLNLLIYSLLKIKEKNSRLVINLISLALFILNFGRFQFL